MIDHDKVIQELCEKYKNEDCIFSDDIFIKHWVIGRYIRNKYIWLGKEVVKCWCDYYNVLDADTVSMRIIDEVRNTITLQNNLVHQN